MFRVIHPNRWFIWAIVLIVVMAGIILGVIEKEKIYLDTESLQLSSLQSTTRTLIQYEKLFDTDVWELEKIIDISKEVSSEATFVLSLRSKEKVKYYPACNSDDGCPIPAANFLLVKNGIIVYQYADMTPSVDHPENISILGSIDLTKDGARELIIRGDTSGASNWFGRLAILDINANGQSTDIDEGDFADSSLSKTYFLTKNADIYMLYAQEEWAAGESHYEPHFVNYELWTWDQRGSKFIIVERSRSQDRKSSSDISDWLLLHPDYSVVELQQLQ